MPGEWDVEDGENDGYTWEMGEVEYLNEEELTGPCAVVSSAEQIWIQMDESLISPPINCRGFSRVHLTFRHWFRTDAFRQINLELQD